MGMSIDVGETAINIEDIVATDDLEFYACGALYLLHGAVLFWKSGGQDWQRVIITDSRLAPQSIYCAAVQDKDTVWLGTSEGDLWCGNSRSGFNHIASLPESNEFTSIAIYDGSIYAGGGGQLNRWTGSTFERQTTSPVKMFAGIVIKDPKRGSVETDIDGEFLQVIDGYLWAFGDLGGAARFDGKKWERIPIPSYYRGIK